MSSRTDSTSSGGNSHRKLTRRGNCRVPGVFLDRDGTLNEEVGYVNHLNRMKLYPWATEAVRKLNHAGVPVIVVTNQSGVARGYFTEDLVNAVHKEIATQLASHGAHIDAFYYCPHHPDAPLPGYREQCQCRKPATGMVDQAARRFHIDPASSYVVGDSYRDMRLGFNIGAQTILVMTGYGLGEFEYHRKQWPRQPHFMAENLLEAATKILEDMKGRARLSLSKALVSREL